MFDRVCFEIRLLAVLLSPLILSQIENNKPGSLGPHKLHTTIAHAVTF